MPKEKFMSETGRSRKKGDNECEKNQDANGNGKSWEKMAAAEAGRSWLDFPTFPKHTSDLIYSRSADLISNTSMSKYTDFILLEAMMQ